MAVLRQGSVISATVEQSLGNCLLISFKHRSRTFRGVLFDEKNAVVPRITANKRESSDHDLMANKSALPLGMAIVSPSKQPYSSLRNRIYYNTNAKRTGSSNAKGNGAKNGENKSTSVNKVHQELMAAISKQSSNTNSQKKMELSLTSSAERRKNSRLLRSQSRNGAENASGLKRKAETELFNSKPTKTRPSLQSNNMSVSCQTTKKNTSKSQKKMTTSKPNNTNDDKVSLELNDVEAVADNLEKLECDEVLNASPLLEDGGDSVDDLRELEYRSPNSIKQNLFPLEQDNHESNVFSNDQADFHEDLNNEHGRHGLEESDTVAAFFGSLGFDRKNSSEKDDASVFTDSGASTSSSDQLFHQNEALDELKNALDNKNELESNDGENGDVIDKEKVNDKLSPNTPTKKSARISAKRAILEKNIDSYNDENTIWSIWGGLPQQKQQQKQKMGLSDENLQLITQEDNVNMSPDSISSSEIPLPHELNKPSVTTANKIKGPRIKQTPIRVKKVIARPAVQPEKQVSVGNVVWGKVHGHPWWPGRVLAVSGNIGEGNEMTQHAHVTWFGSNTSSIMPVNELQHFLANFNRRFKKAKKGCYRKAVKQAQEMLQIMGEIN